MATLKQKPSNEPIEFVRGCSYSLTFVVNVNLTGATIESGINWGDGSGGTTTLFTITPGTYSTTSTFSISLTKEQSDLITTENNEWFLNITITNTKTPYFLGKCRVVQ